MSRLVGTSVLVTGGAGFVGGNLVRRLLAENVESIHICDSLLSSERANVPADARVRFTEGSIGSELILGALADEYDYVFHLATYHGNQNSIERPLADCQNNLLPTLQLFDRIRRFRRLKKVVYSGAGCAVAEKTWDHALPTAEEAPITLGMDSPYSISKIVGEFYAVYYYQRHGLPTVRARFQNVYGPGEILGAGEWRGTPATVWRNVTPTFVYKAIKRQPLVLEADGTATRDFVYVDDIVEGLLACATRGAIGSLYNLASGVETSISTLATIINELTGNTAPSIRKPRREWDNSGKRFGNPAKARAELDFEVRMSLRSGLSRTIDWTRQNIALIDRCIAKHQAEMTNGPLLSAPIPA